MQVTAVPRGLALAAAVVLLAAGCDASPSGSASPADAPVPVRTATIPAGATSPRPTAPPSAAAVVADPDGAPCVGAAVPARWEHVVWIWFENKPDTTVLGSPQAPYLTARRAAVRHGRRLPRRHAPVAAELPRGDLGRDPRRARRRLARRPPVAGASIFSQVADAGLQWRSYEEAMPSPCALAPQGRYAVKHNPVAYYTGLRAQCAQWDVPFGELASDLASGALPAFSFVTPDLCNDTHDCPVATGDRWLSQVLPTILRSRPYTSGTTAVLVTYDEDDSAHGNRVPLVVVAPSVPPGAVLSGTADHYGLLRTTEQMLGLPLLGAASSASVLPYLTR